MYATFAGRGAVALCAALALIGPHSVAAALPRFAARNSQECIQCHINPTGGGMRNEYGRNVFQNAVLPASSVTEPKSWLAQPFPSEEQPASSAEPTPVTPTALGFSP